MLCSRQAPRRNAQRARPQRPVSVSVSQQPTSVHSSILLSLPFWFLLFSLPFGFSWPAQQISFLFPSAVDFLSLHFSSPQFGPLPFLSPYVFLSFTTLNHIFSVSSLPLGALRLPAPLCPSSSACLFISGGVRGAEPWSLCVQGGGQMISSFSFGSAFRWEN